MSDYGDAYAEAVAAELRAERARKGVTLAHLVTETGIAQSTVQRYLNGKRDIPIAAYLELCRVLEVSPMMIFERAEQTLKQ